MTQTKSPSAWKFGGLTPMRLLARTGKAITEDDIFGRSAQLSYYFLLALFPLLFFLISLLGFFAGSGSQLRASLFNYLGNIMPAAAGGLITKTMDEITHASGGGKVIFGLLGALWAASNGIGAISDALNIAYHLKETRSWLKKRGTVVGLTAALSILIIAALVLVLYGGKIAESIASHFAFGNGFVFVWKIIQWPIVLGLLLTGFALTYYLAPNLESRKWSWISPGAVAGLVLWLVGSFGFRIYLHYFNSYSATYGSLGAVIVLMLWFYITGAAILIGGELNSQIKQAETYAAGLESEAAEVEMLYLRHPQADSPRSRHAA